MELLLSIPNRTVKRASADNSFPATGYEGRSWPAAQCFFVLLFIQMRKLLTIIFLCLVVVWCNYFDTNIRNPGKYTNNKYHFSIEYPTNYQIYYLPDNLGVYFRPIGRPVWEQTVISVLVLPYSRYLVSAENYKNKLIDFEDTGKLIESIIDRGDYAIQLIYNSPDKPSGLDEYQTIVDSLKIW